MGSVVLANVCPFESAQAEQAWKHKVCQELHKQEDSLNNRMEEETISSYKQFKQEELYSRQMETS